MARKSTTKSRVSQTGHSSRKSTKKQEGLGNPAIAMAVTSFLASPTFKWMLIGGGLLVGYTIVKGQAKDIVDQKQKDAVADEYSDSTKNGLAAQYAAQFYQAVDGIGTDETMIFNTANAMYRNGIPFDLVNKAYKNLYNANLLEDLQGDLSSTDFQRFNAILRGQQLYGLGSVSKLL